jgi:hypothetical protein
MRSQGDPNWPQRRGKLPITLKPVKMPRRAGSSGLRQLCNYNRGILGL